MRRRERRVRVADPRHRRRGVERHVERRAARIGDDAARLLEQHRGADVVGVARERVGVDERAQVGDEAVAAGDQLVELPARRDVLVVEHVAAAEAARTASASSSASATLPGTKNLASPREPVLEVGGRRRPHARAASRRPSRRSTRSATTPPPRVPLSWSAAPCFAVGQLGHRRRDDVAQRAAARRGGGEAPRRRACRTSARGCRRWCRRSRSTSGSLPTTTGSSSPSDTTSTSGQCCSNQSSSVSSATRSIA